MSYLCKYIKTGKLFVISNSLKELPIGRTISIVNGDSFRVLQEIEIR